MRMKDAQRAQDEAQKRLEQQENDEIHHFLNAANAGDADAQYHLGLVYSKYGDMLDAARLFQKAATQGYAAAEYQLGQISERTNRDEAIQWYDRAYGHGLADARGRIDAMREMKRQEDTAAKQAAALARLAERIDEIVTKDSGGWSYDKYMAGSLHNVEVVSQDNLDIVVRGYFRYISSYDGSSNPWVMVKFHDFRVSCITYWNFADTCRPAND
jgi:tetratricopeptide (TPR) repeat protein